MLSAPAPPGSSRRRRPRSPSRGRPARRRLAPRASGRPPPRRWRRRARRPSRSAPRSTPVRTSPVPAVASCGLETVLTATRSPSVTIESSPLSRTIAPLRGAASRALSSRFASISAESRSSRRPISPACGVRTSGPLAVRRAPRCGRACALSPSASRTSGASIRWVSSRARRWVPCSRPMPGAEHDARPPARWRRGSAPTAAGRSLPSRLAQPSDITSVSLISKIGSRSAGHGDGRVARPAADRCPEPRGRRRRSARANRRRPPPARS